MDIDVRPHPAKLRHMHVAVLEDRLLEEAVASARASIAMNCACMSVAKPGNGEVDSASGFSPPSALTLIPRLWNSITGRPGRAR